MNDKQKQIEETAKDLLAVECGVEICEAWHCSGCKYEQYKENYFCESIRKSEALCEKGYRKQSDTAREIVKQLKELLHKHEYRSQTDGVSFFQMNAESFCDEINELAAQYNVEV